MISVKLLYRRPDGATPEGVPITTGYVAIQAVRRYDTTAGEMTTVAFQVPIGSNVQLDPGDWKFTLLEVPDGLDGFLEGSDAVTIRSVPSAVPTADIPSGKINTDGSVDVDDLPEVPEILGGTGSVGLPPDFLAQFTALQAQVAAISVSGGASSLGAISGISTDAKTLIATPNSFGDMRNLLGAATTAAAASAQATANAALPANTLGTGNGPAKLSADGLSVLRADGTVFTGGVAIGTVAGSAVDAARYAGDIADVPMVIYEGDARYGSHPITQRSVHFYGTTDPGNNGDRVLGGGGLAPPGVASTGQPIIDVWCQVIP